MATQPTFDKPLSIEEYLAMDFEHDCDYVDGVVEERDLGEFEHSSVQGLLAGLFLKYRAEWGVYPLPEQRMRTQKTRFHIPDVVILLEGSRHEPVLTHPPFLTIEVQSPDRPLRRTEAKAKEYLAFGVEHVWVIDPYARVSYRGTSEGLELVRDGELAIPGTPIRIVPAELFAELDRV